MTGVLQRRLAAVLALVLMLGAWLAGVMQPARAAEEVALRGLEVAETEDGAQVILLVTRAVSFDVRVLPAPLRLEMVIPGLRAAQAPRLRAVGGLVAGVRLRAASGGVVLAFPLRAPALIAGAHAERAAGGKPARLVVSLQRTDAATLAALLGVPATRLQERQPASAPAAEGSRAADARAAKRDGRAQGDAGGTTDAGAAEAVKAAFRRLVEQVAATPATIDELIRAMPATFGDAEQDGAAAGDGRSEGAGKAKEEKEANGTRGGGRKGTPSATADSGAPARFGKRHEAAAQGAAPVIVVDAGHGGRDPGAVDGQGRKEKDIVLRFAHALREALSARGYRVVMTRSGDTFLKLRERSAVARRNHAALFISIHADKFRSRGVSGLGIYTLSERASDEDAAELARMENAADLIGAPEERLEDDAVRDILVELTQRETNANSHLLAQQLVRSLKGVVRLRRNPVRSAAFRVLRLPEIPSLLIELGYITNPRDVRDMLSPAWRKRVAGRMAQTIDRFLRTRLARN